MDQIIETTSYEGRAQNHRNKQGLSVSARGRAMPPSPIRKLKPYADKALAEGKSIYNMNIGQPDIVTPRPMLEAIKNLKTQVIAYGPSQGLPEYQDALIKYYSDYGIDLGRDNIIVTAGGSEAIIMGFIACLNPEDEVLVPEPFYTNYNGFAIASDVRIKPVTTSIENDWELPPIEKIEQLITPKTRAILICNPNNPTGKLYGQEELKKIALLARKHNLFIFSDEVYREIVFDPKSRYVSLYDLGVAGIEDNVVIVDSISKRYSACGARLGALVSKNKEVMKAALAIAQARLCPPTLAQHLALPSVSLGAEYFDEIVAQYKARRDIVLEGLGQMQGVTYRVPQGAFYITVKLPVDNAEDFVIWLLTDYHIDNETLMLAPAEGFYATPGLGRDEVRIAFVLNEEKTKRAMNLFRKGLEEYLRISQS